MRAMDLVLPGPLNNPQKNQYPSWEKNRAQSWWKNKKGSLVLMGRSRIILGFCLLCIYRCNCANIAWPIILGRGTKSIGYFAMRLWGSWLVGWGISMWIGLFIGIWSHRIFCLPPIRRLWLLRSVILDSLFRCKEKENKKV